MPFYLPHLPDDASEELRLAYASAGAVARLLPIVAAANPANRDAMWLALEDVIRVYGQGDSPGAAWIRDNFARPENG